MRNVNEHRTCGCLTVLAAARADQKLGRRMVSAPVDGHTLVVIAVKSYALIRLSRDQAPGLSATATARVIVPKASVNVHRVTLERIATPAFALTQTTTHSGYNVSAMEKAHAIVNGESANATIHDTMGPRVKNYDAQASQIALRTNTHSKKVRRLMEDLSSTTSAAAVCRGHVTIRQEPVFARRDSMAMTVHRGEVERMVRLSAG